MKRFFHIYWITVLLVLTGCAPTVTKPSVNLISGNKAPYFINSITTSFPKPPTSKTLKPEILQALGHLTPSDNLVGRPAILKIFVESFYEVGPTESFLVGGDDSIKYSVQILDEESNAVIYQIGLLDYRGGYAPGGLAGALDQINVNKERILARKMARRVQTTVLHDNKVPVSREAIKGHWVEMARAVENACTVGRHSDECSSLRQRAKPPSKDRLIRHDGKRERVKVFRRGLEYLSNEQLVLLLAGSEVDATGEASCISTPGSGPLSVRFNFDFDGTFTVTYRCDPLFGGSDGGFDDGKWWVEDNSVCIEPENPTISSYYPTSDICFEVAHGRNDFGLYTSGRPVWTLEIAHPRFLSKESLLAAIENKSRKQEVASKTPIQTSRGEYIFTNKQITYLLAGSKVQAKGESACAGTQFYGPLTIDFSFHDNGTFKVDYFCETPRGGDVGTDVGKWWVENGAVCIDPETPSVDVYYPTSDICFDVGFGKYDFGFYSTGSRLWTLNVSHSTFSSKRELHAALKKMSEN